MTDLDVKVGSMEIDHPRVKDAGPKDDVAIGVVDKVREGDKVYLEVP